MSAEEELQTFCRSGCDRYDYLEEWFHRERIEASVIKTEDLNHFLVRPGKERGYDRKGYLKTLVAHYDRFPGSPGANDNGAAVMQLLALCRYLEDGRYTHNCQILLTDGEELGEKRNRTDQGSFLLGKLFRDNGLEKTVMIILDMCGIGDTMIYSTGMEKLNGAASEREKKMFRPVINLIRSYSRGKALPVTEKYSDDLGFLAHDFLTLQVSLIKWKERFSLQEGEIPESWQTMHTPLDEPDRLEKQSFRIMEGFLKGVSKTLI